eukprot:8037795-Ditylum_brightwellii.AAC.1
MVLTMVMKIVLKMVMTVLTSTSHISQGVDCHLTWRSKGNKHVVGDKDDGVDNGVDNSDDNSDDSADKHLTHLSQG